MIQDPYDWIPEARPYSSGQEAYTSSGDAERETLIALGEWDPAWDEEEKPTGLVEPGEKKTLDWSDAWDGGLGDIIGDMTPFVAGVKELAEAKSLWEAADRVKNDTATPEDFQLIQAFMEEAGADKTVGYHINSILRQLPAFAVELWAGVGVARLGAKGAAKLGIEAIQTGLEKTIKDRALRSTARKLTSQATALEASGEVAEGAMKRKAAEGLMKTIVKDSPVKAITEAGKLATASTIGSEAVTSVAGGLAGQGWGGRSQADAYRRAFQKAGITMKRDEAGRLALDFAGELETFWDSLPAGIANTFVEHVSERMGGTLMRLPIINRLEGLQSAVAARFMGKHKMKPAELMEFLDKFGWDGPIEEYMEERAAGWTRGIFFKGEDEWYIGEDEDGYYFKTEMLFPDWKQHAGELAAFAIAGQGASSLHGYFAGDKDPMARVRGARTLAEVETGVLRKTFEQKLTEAKDENGIPLGPVAVEALRSGQAGMEDYDRIAKVINAPGNEGVAEAATDAGIRGFRPEGPTVLPTVETEAAKWAGTFGDKDVPGKVVGPSTAYQRQLKEQFADYVDIVFVEGGPKFDSTATGHWSGATEGGQHVRGTVYMNAGLREDQPGGALTLLSKVFHEATHDYQWLNDRHKKVALDALFEGNNSLVESTRLDYFTPFILNETVQTVKEEGVEGEEGWKKETTDELWSPDFLTLDREGRLKEVERYKKEIWDPKRKDPRKEEQEEMEAQLAENYADVLEFLHLQNGAEYIEKLKKRSPRTIERLRDWFAFKVNRFRSENDQLPTGEAARMERLSQQLTGLKDSTETFKIASTFKDAMSVLGGPLGRRKGLVAAPPEEGAKPTEQAEPSPEIQQIAEEMPFLEPKKEAKAAKEEPDPLVNPRHRELIKLGRAGLEERAREIGIEDPTRKNLDYPNVRELASGVIRREEEQRLEAEDAKPKEAPVGETQTELTWPEIQELSDRPFDFEELQAVQEIIATGKPGKKQIGDVELSVTNAGVWTKRGNRASVFLSNEEFEGTYPPDVGWLSPVKLAKEGGDLEGKNVADLKHIAASLNLPISSRFTVDGVALGQKKDGTPKRRTLRMDELRRSIKARREELEGDDSDLPTREAAPQYKTLSDLSREEREEVLRHAEEIGTSGIPEMNKADISRENAEQWGISPEEMHGLYIDSTPQRIRAVTPRRAKILDDALKLTNEGRGHMNLADISDETADDWSITAQEMHNLFFAAEEAHRLVAQGRSPMNLADIVGETAHDLEEFGVSQEEVGHLLFGAHDLANPVTREAAPQVVYTDAKRRPAGRKDLGAAWYIPNEDKIYVNRVAARKKYEEKAWTKPKLEGVTALPEDAFGSYEEWEQWLIDHESYHAKEPREGQFPANAAFENRANEYATLTGLERAGRWAETKQMRSEILERERAQRPKLAGGAPEARREPVEPRYVEGVKPRQLIGPRMPHEGPGREERVAEERVLGIAGREELPEEEPQFVKTVPAVPLTEAQYAPIAEAQRKQEEMYEQLGGETGKGLGLRKEYIGRPGLRKVISGGQTGADRISLEAAKGRYVTGGTAPKGFRTSRGDDPSLAEFGLEEHESRDWLPRTEVNVQNSDGTLVLGDPTKPGSAKTIGFSKKHRKPFIINPTVGEFKKWIEENDIRTLNGAGNRTYEDAEYVEKLLEAVHDPLLAEEDAELQAVLDADRAALKKDREQVEARRKQVRTELFSEIFPEGFDDAVLDGYHIIGVSREGGEHQIVEHLVGPEDTPQEAAEKAIGVPFLHGPGIGMAPSEAEHLRGALSDKDKLIYENAAQDAHEQSYEPYVTFREFEVDQKDRRRGNELWEDDLSFKQKGTYRDLKRTVSNLIAGASPLSRKIVPQETKVPMEEGGKWLPFETAFARYVNALNELRYLQENYDQPIYQRTGKWGIGQKQEAGFRKIASQQQRLIDEAKSERHEELERDVSEGDLQPFGYGRVGAELASGELAKPSQIPFKGRAPGKISDVDERGRIVEGKVGSYTTEEVDQLAHQMKLDRGEQKRIKNRKSTAAGKRIDPGAERLNEEGPVEAVIERAVSRIAKMKQEIDSGETTSWRLVGRMGVEKATMQAANRDLLVVKGTTLERLNMTPHAKGVHRLSPKQDEAFESEEFSAEGAEAALEKLRSEFAGRPTVLAAGLGTATKEEIDKEQDEWDTRLETELIDKTLLQDVAEEQEAAYEARGQQPADIDLVQMKAQQEGRWQPEVLEDPFNYKSWMKIPEAEGGGLTTQEVKTPSTSGSFSPETLPGDVEDPGKVLGLLELSPDAVDTVKSRREPTTLSGSFERYKGDGIYTLPEGTQVFLQQIAPESYTLEPIGLRARAEDFGGAEPAKHLRPVSVTDAEERMRPDVRSYETQASPPPPSPFRAHPRPRPVRTFYAKLSHFKDWDYVNNRPYPRFETTGEVTSVRVRREAKEEAKVFLSPLLNGLDGTAHEAAQAYIKADNAANLVVEALVNDMQENREAKLQAALDLDEGDPRSIEVSRLRRLDEQARETLIREPSAGRIPAGYKRHAALVYGNQGIGKYLMLRPELTMPGKPGLSGIFSPQYLETLAKGKREPTLNDLMAGLKALEESAKQRARIAREALSPEWIGAKFGVGSGLIQTAQQQAWRYTYVVHGEGIRSGNVPVGELISVFADEGGMAMFDGKRAIPVDPEMASSIAEVLEGHNTPDMKRFDLLQRVATSSGIMRLTEGEATRLGELGYNLRPLDGALDRHFTKETWLSATSYGSAGSNREYFLRNPQDVEVYLAALHAELSHEEMVEKFGHDIFTLSQNERFISTIRRLEAEDLAFANYVLGHFVTKLVADPELIGGQLVGEYLPGRPIPFVEPDLTVTARVNFVAKSLFSNRENSLGMGIEAAEIALPPQEQRRRMRFFARTGKGFRAGRPRGLRETRVDPALPGWKPGKAPKEQPSIVDRYDPNVVGAAAQVRAPVDEYEEESAREAAPQMSPFARRVLTGDQLSDYTNWKKLGEKMVNRYLPFTDWERVLEGQKDPETGQYIEIPRSMRLSLRQAMKRGELSYKQAEIEKRLFKPLQDVILNRRSGRKKLGFGQEMTFKDAETLSKMLAVQEKHNVLLGRQPKEREGLPVGMRPAGIDPYEAKKEINKLTKRYGKEHVAALEKAVMAISAETRKIWGRAELVSAPVLAFLAKSYPHYVPYSEHEMQELQEWKEMYDPDVLRMNDVAKNMDKFVKTLGSDAMMATDRGSDMRQPMFRTALGMTSETKDSPLLMLMAQLNHALDKELDAQISHSVIDLIKLGQEHGVYNIATIVPESERTYQRLVVRKDRPDEAARGLATDVRNPDFADNPLVYVAAGVDGARTIIEFHPNYAQIPLALKNENMPKGSIINALDYAKALTRFISAMITRWNPMFSVPNFVRDTTTASAHMTAEYGPKIAAEMFLRPSLLGSIKTLMKANYAIANGTYDADAPEFADDPDMVLFERYRASGAPVTFLDLGKTRGLEDWFKEIHQYHNPSEVHQLQFWKGKASALVGYVENFNDAFENAARFAYFKYGIEKGLPSKLVEGENMDDQELGFGAKNLTVNFEARGTIGGLFNSLYMFANANIQSNARLIDAIFSRDREGKRSFQPHAKSLVGGIVTLHAAVAIMNAAIGGTDPDDDETYWAKIPDWDKRANLILLNWMGQDGKGIKIPLPYGYNFFAAIGNMFGEVWSGTKTKDEVSPYLFETALQAFSPVGGGTDITDMVTPTVAKPFFEVRNNRDWKGSAIYKNRYGNDSIPDSELAFDSVDKDVQALTDWLNEAAGGNKYRSGKFLGIDMSINPATIEHMAQFLGGGIGKEGIRAKKVYEQISEGEEVAVGDVPLLRRFALAPTKYSAASLYRERRKEIIQVENMWKAGMDLSEEDRRLIGLSSAKRHAETSIKRIRERRRLYDRDSEEYKRSEERERSVQNAFNKRWNKIMKATASS